MARNGRTDSGPAKHLVVDPAQAQPPTRDLPAGAKLPDSLPEAKQTKVHPTNAGGENASLLFVGTATTILYVYAGDHSGVVGGGGRVLSYGLRLTCDYQRVGGHQVDD